MSTLSRDRKFYIAIGSVIILLGLFSMSLFHDSTEKRDRLEAKQAEVEAEKEKRKQWELTITNTERELELQRERTKYMELESQQAKEEEKRIKAREEMKLAITGLWRWVDNAQHTSDTEIGFDKDIIFIDSGNASGLHIRGTNEGVNEVVGNGELRTRRGIDRINAHLTFNSGKVVGWYSLLDGTQTKFPLKGFKVSEAQVQQERMQAAQARRQAEEEQRQAAEAQQRAEEEQKRTEQAQRQAARQAPSRGVIGGIIDSGVVNMRSYRRNRY